MQLRKIVIHAGPNAELAYGAANGNELHLYVGEGLKLIPEDEKRPVTRVTIDAEHSAWIMQDVVASGQE